MKNHVKVWENLNDLIQINRDRIKGYEAAMSEVGKDTHLGRVFCQHKTNSEKMVEDLNQAVISIKHHPETTGTVKGALHRSWLEIKNAFGSRDKEDLLEDCEFGDKAALETYENVLSDEDADYPTNIHALLLKQKQQIQAAYDRIRTLEKVYDAVEA